MFGAVVQHDSHVGLVGPTTYAKVTDLAYVIWIQEDVSWLEISMDYTVQFG